MSGNYIDKFNQDRIKSIESFSNDDELKSLTNKWVMQTMSSKYVYNFDWLGRPIIQYPQDIVAIQELIWKVKPDLIIETGVAHGGSLILSASILALLDISDASKANTQVNPNKSNRKVVGIDIDIRPHNRKKIEDHSLSCYIEMIQGSSISKDVISQVKNISEKYKKIMVLLDSSHTYKHVLSELEAYAPLVSPGSYCVVFDTFVEDMPKGFFEDRPWDPGNSPKTAVVEFLETHNDFEIDQDIQNKILITVSPDGYLRKKL